jgi:RNase H-fold protein (predicted Holliday junction resolvase)
LGLDYGRRTVGLAVSTLGLAPRPLDGLPGVQGHEQMRLAADVLAIARREACDAVVVGLPVTREGQLCNASTDSQQGRRCRTFAKNLAAMAADHAVLVFLANEQGSTMAAQQALELSGSRRSTIGKVRCNSTEAMLVRDCVT